MGGTICAWLDGWHHLWHPDHAGQTLLDGWHLLFLLWCENRLHPTKVADRWMVPKVIAIKPSMCGWYLLGGACLDWVARFVVRGLFGWWMAPIGISLWFVRGWHRSDLLIVLRVIRFIGPESPWGRFGYIGIFCPDSADSA
jgi:hypothetical protein